ncbi:MAG: basic amino acid ABC transporter substrate-binding protein [Methanomicrobiales archaeon]|nr:basic amino acid ABC transporter substrate-binding protein [Methanomicrobiales archaeon]
MDRRLLIAGVLCMAVLSICFAGCTGTETPAGGEQAIATQASESTDAPTYIVGIDVPYPPFSMIDKEGKAIGFDVESMEWIAEDQGFNVEFQQVAWDGIIPALLAKKIDMVYSGMTITEERKEKVAFSDSYWTVNQAVIARADSTLVMDDILSGEKTIGTQRGCTAAIWIDENMIQAGQMPEENLKLYDNIPLAITDLESGRVDAVMYDSTVINDIIQGKDVTKIGYVETNEQFGIAVRKEDTELLQSLNEGLAKLMADTHWQELQDKYGMI